MEWLLTLALAIVVAGLSNVTARTVALGLFLVCLAFSTVRCAVDRCPDADFCSTR